MKYAVAMGSGAIIYVPSFIQIGSSIQKLWGRGFMDTQTAW
jgi:tRNA A58 N-methylase Trm61